MTYNKLLTIIKNFFNFKRMKLKRDFNGKIDFETGDRRIDYIVIHCTATPQNTKVESIIRYWKYVLGWEYPGYHVIIDKDGEATQLLDMSIPSNGVKGYNENSVHISYIGGVDENNKPIDNRTNVQKLRMEGIVWYLKYFYPEAEVLGHRDFPGVKKDCPCFDVKEWYKQMNLKYEAQRNKIR